MRPSSARRIGAFAERALAAATADELKAHELLANWPVPTIERTMKTNALQAEHSDPGLPSAIRWLVGVVGALILIAAFLVPVGLASLFLAPMAVVFGVGMWAVWIARRRRQRLEGRDAQELKDASSTDRPWPTEGVIDDRLEDPLATTSGERPGGPP